jgi:hypothetical protein
MASVWCIARSTWCPIAEGRSRASGVPARGVINQKIERRRRIEVRLDRALRDERVPSMALDTREQETMRANGRAKWTRRRRRSARAESSRRLCR